VSKQTYHPRRGDVIHLNFSPAAGQEFGLAHYGVVISTVNFSKATGLCIVLPATTKYHPEKKLLGTHLMVKMPKLNGLTGEGWVYTHQIKTIDYRERGATYTTAIDEDNLDFLIDIMERARAFIDPDAAQ
jgi:mRNA-degrading endonuclease toxin of MazEF toxin-antitoxin module